MRKVLLAAGALALLCGACHRPEPAPERQTRVAGPPRRNPYFPQPLPPQYHQPLPRSSPVPVPGQTWYPQAAALSNRWTQIVVHHSATAVGGAKSFDNAHRARGWDELGYHFVIGNGTSTPDGYIEVGTRWTKQKHGAHCKTPDNYFNEHGIGICLVGDFTRGGPTRRQLAALERLTRFLTWACRIPVERITTHRDVTHKTQCPGANFPIAAIRRAVANPATASSMK